VCVSEVIGVSEHALPKLWPVLLMARKLDFQSSNKGSIPLRATWPTGLMAATSGSQPEDSSSILLWATWALPKKGDL
jgi:hypothetical protein